MSKIRICHGDNEIEMEGSDEFIEKYLKSFYERIGFSQTKNIPLLKETLLKVTEKGDKEAPTPAEFYKVKGKTDGISQILIFGKYLEKYRDKAEFSPSDINQLVAEAKLPKDIHGQYFSNAVKQGLLRSHPGGKYSLTLSAEEVIGSI